MELLQYWDVLRRRWWLPVALTLIAFLASAAIALRGASAYRTELRLAVSTQPTVDRAAALYYDPIYYANLSSEYLADDLSEIIRSEAFGADVLQELGLKGDPESVARATRTRKTHRLIDVTITTSTASEGMDIATAMERILNDRARMSGYLRALDAYSGQVAIVNRPVVKRSASGLGMVSEVGLRSLVGLLVGMGLAFLVDYLDQTLRSRREVEQALGLPVLGEVPTFRAAAAR